MIHSVSNIYYDYYFTASKHAVLDSPFMVPFLCFFVALVDQLCVAWLGKLGSEARFI